MRNNLFLSSPEAEELYGFVKNLPIVDYHNHLSLADIAENKRYYSIYELWIKPDPYKHRAMRMCGVPEKYITGDSPEEEKFAKWCEIFPLLIGNPLYHWSVTELEYFGTDLTPNKETAKEIYDFCNEYLKTNTVCVSSLLDRFNVEYVCPCASLTDDTAPFETNSKTVPSLRGDDIVSCSPSFIKKLSDITKTAITDTDSLQKAITCRLQVFKNCGCRFSDHALDNGFEFFEDDGKNNLRFLRILDGSADSDCKKRFSSYILKFLAGEYSKIGFVMQLHIGAQRSTSTRLRNIAGPAGGYACIGNSVNIITLTDFLDSVEQSPFGLPKIILFTLNPADNELISVLSGSYSKDGVAGLITQGPAWWWCDHRQGIENIFESITSFGLLHNFVGMTTDSRSFLSFARHDYFRRILCNWAAEKVRNDDFICSKSELKNLLYKICYENAKNIFKEE